MTHDNPQFQEQAFHLCRNIADGVGVEMVFEGLGPSVLLSAVSKGLDSEHDDVLRQVRTSAVVITRMKFDPAAQAAYLLGNLANSPSHQRDILAHPRILHSLRQCLIDAKVDVRRPAVACVRELVRANPHSYRELHDAGIDTTLRHMCDYGGGLVAASPTASAFTMGVEEDSEVREKAREALRWLERNSEMSM